MKKFLILALAVVVFAFSPLIHANAASPEPSAQVYYRFGKSLQPNKYYLTIINHSPQTVTFFPRGDANYLNLKDGTTLILAEVKDSADNGMVSIAPGKKQSLAFYINPADIREAKTITFKGVGGGKTFIVTYDIRTTEITVEDEVK